MKKALITGITGQDGGYLALRLLNLGYQVIGLVRRVSHDYPEGALRLPELSRYIKSRQLILEYGDVTDTCSLARVFRKYEFDEVYNLAAQSHVARSFEMPDLTRAVNYFGALNVLDAMRTFCPEGCFYQASTSEMFGKAKGFPIQNEDTPFKPVSPYGVSKQDAHWGVGSARESKVWTPVHTACGILFNHESEVRGRDFVTRKTTMAVAKIHLGQQEVLELGNVDSKRDWGYAPDYVIAMHLMLQQRGVPQTWQDYVIATGKQRTIREFVEAAFRPIYPKAEMHWENDDADGNCTHDTIFCVDGVTRVKINPEFFRPVDVETLCGNPQKAIDELGWDPHRTSFEDMVRLMLEHDLTLARRDS